MMHAYNPLVSGFQMPTLRMGNTKGVEPQKSSGILLKTQGQFYETRGNLTPDQIELGCQAGQLVIPVRRNPERGIPADAAVLVLKENQTVWGRIESTDTQKIFLPHLP